jgi:hypothetical protein
LIEGPVVNAHTESNTLFRYEKNGAAPRASARTDKYHFQKTINLVFTTFNSAVESLHIGRFTGLESGTRLMFNSTLRSGGNPFGRSAGKTEYCPSNQYTVNLTKLMKNMIINDFFAHFEMVKNAITAEMVFLAISKLAKKPFRHTISQMTDWAFRLF